MIIEHISHHSWHKQITEDPMHGLSSGVLRKLRPSLAKLPESLSYSFEPLSEELLEWFTPFYTDTISTKNNPLVFDIKNNTLQHPSGRDYFALVLKEDNQVLGATIFSLRKTYLSVAYRLYQNNWLEAKLQTKPSFYAEYLISQHAWEHGYKKLSHGRDRNIYGVNSAIGLATFKLSVGCKAYPDTKEHEILRLDTDSLESDALIIEYQSDSAYLQKGYLVTTEENFEKYSQVTKYPEQLQIEVLYR